MQKRIYFYISMLCALAPALLHADVLKFDDLCLSRTVFVPRSVTHDSTFELAMNNWDFYHPQNPDDCNWLNVYLTPFYQRSFNNRKTARYFFPHEQEQIVLAQDGTGDVNPVWLNLLCGQGQNYRSILSMTPRRTEAGVNIALYKEFPRELNRGIWIAVVFTPMYARTNLHLCEKQQNCNGIVDNIQNGIDALNNPELLFGKFSSCPLKRFGNDDIQIKVGYNQYTNDFLSHRGLYFVGTIPTGIRPCNEYIFEPRIGTRHGAFGFGVNIDNLVCQSDNYIVSWMVDFKYRYLFGHRECRSFDLCQNGEWSRFLQVVPSNDRSNSSFGINSCFTQKVKVKPRSQIDFWTAIHWKHCNFNWEFGYDFWFRQSEKIRFKNCKNNNCCPFGIYDIAGDAARQNGQNQQLGQPISASQAGICQAVTGPNQVVSDLIFTEVGPLDPNSGAHPRVISNKVYGSFAYDTYCWGEPMFFGLGASVEAAVGKTGLDQWAVWGKWGINF